MVDGSTSQAGTSILSASKNWFMEDFTCIGCCYFNDVALSKQVICFGIIIRESYN